MASASSEIDPAAEPQVVVEESSTAGGSEGVAPPEGAAAEVAVEREVAEGEAKEEEEGECGFCLYMKAGECKEVFVAWEECVEASQKEGSDMVERCAEATVNLKMCMDAHADYYAPVLQAEQHVSDQAEAAIAAAAADETKESEPSPATDETKEEAVVESAASAADAKEEVLEQAATSMPAEEAKKEEAVVEKVESSSLGNKQLLGRFFSSRYFCLQYEL